ncbi:MAG: class I SAM-dependent methyltransferase [Candidatus Eremiobacteraeota bacterium]|nr:class I SAM-dependent methyltransferase [Candidatus Eremiobacteraeota bacterium]MCW5868799.1 class I SAM-dependent methyltransferase [Candidatus Eremiobacteraeota bacterium]
MRWQDAIRSFVPPIFVELNRLAGDFDNPVGLWHYWQARRKCAHDAYITWLCQVTGGWLSPKSGNIQAFYHAISRLPPSTGILEVGSFLGLSTNIISYLMHKLSCDAGFFSSDPWIFESTEEPIGGFFDAASPDYRRYVKETFLANGRIYGGTKRSHAFELASDDFFVRWGEAGEQVDLYERSVRFGGGLGFVYIDGNHTHEQSRRDFENSDRFLVPGGFVLFDDSADAGQHEGCRRTVAEVVATGRYRRVFRQPNYFFQKLR